MAAYTEESELDESAIDQELELLEAIYIHELDIQKDNSGHPAVVSVTLHPSTADNLELQYVCLTLVFSLTSEYPSTVPDIAIKNPRGIADEQLTSLSNELNKLAAEKEGSAMLYELIEVAKEALTHNNTPHGQCVICIEDFMEGEAFTKTACYHHYHCDCLARYIQHALDNKEDNEDKKETDKEAKDNDKDQVVCAVCREPISYDLEQLNSAPRRHATNGKYKPDEEMQQLQKKMASLYQKQKEKGGIIDVEAESNKFLIDISVTPTLPMSAIIGSSASNTEQARKNRTFATSTRTQRDSKTDTDHRNKDTKPQPRQYNSDRRVESGEKRSGSSYNRQREDRRDGMRGGSRSGRYGNDRQYYRNDRNDRRDHGERNYRPDRNPEKSSDSQQSREETKRGNNEQGKSESVNASVSHDAGKEENAKTVSLTEDSGVVNEDKHGDKKIENVVQPRQDRRDRNYTRDRYNNSNVTSSHDIDRRGQGRDRRGQGSDTKEQSRDRRGQGSDSREQGRDRRGQGSDSREQGRDRRGQGSDSREQGRDGRGQGSDSREQGQVRRGQGPGPREQGQDRRGQGSDTRKQGQDRRGQGSDMREQNQDRRGQGSDTREQGQDRGQGSDIRDQGRERRGQGQESREQGQDRRGQGADTREQGRDRRGQVSDTRKQGQDRRGQGSDTKEHGQDRRGQSSYTREHGQDRRGQSSYTREQGRDSKGEASNRRGHNSDRRHQGSDRQESSRENNGLRDADQKHLSDRQVSSKENNGLRDADQKNLSDRQESSKEKNGVRDADQKNLSDRQESSKEKNSVNDTGQKHISNAEKNERRRQAQGSNQRRDRRDQQRRESDKPNDRAQGNYNIRYDSDKTEETKSKTRTGDVENGSSGKKQFQKNGVDSVQSSEFRPSDGVSSKDFVAENHVKLTRDPSRRTSEIYSSPKNAGDHQTRPVSSESDHGDRNQSRKVGRGRGQNTWNQSHYQPRNQTKDDNQTSKTVESKPATAAPLEKMTLSINHKDNSRTSASANDISSRSEYVKKAKAPFEAPKRKPPPGFDNFR